MIHVILFWLAFLIPPLLLLIYRHFQVKKLSPAMSGLTWKQRMILRNLQQKTTLFGHEILARINSELLPDYVYTWTEMKQDLQHMADAGLIEVTHMEEIGGIVTLNFWLRDVRC